MRIVSLFPAGTELVAALGLGDRLVGVDHRSDHPAAQGLPRLSALALALPSDAAGVEAAMAQAKADGLAPWRLDAAALAALKPDWVLVQDTCGLCALDASAVAPALPSGAQLLPLRLEALGDLGPCLRALGARLGATAAGEAAAAAVAAEWTALAQALAGRKPKKAVLVEWADPPWVAGHWGPELLAAAGAVDLLGEAGGPSRRLSWEALAASEPEVVLVAPCGEGLAVACEAAAALRARPELAGWAETADWWALDGDRLTARLGPGAPQAAALLAGLLHPEVGPGDPPEAWARRA